MMQVVTGMDCQNANSTNNYLVPPVDSKFPEKIPILKNKQEEIEGKPDQLIKTS